MHQNCWEENVYSRKGFGKHLFSRKTNRECCASGKDEYRGLEKGNPIPLVAFWSFQVSEAEMNGQFESVCESVFSEVESQAMEALDLPGCFRTRSHSYLRAIQAGYSQDDECVPSMSSSTVTSTIRSTTGESPGRVSGSLWNALKPPIQCDWQSY